MLRFEGRVRRFHGMVGTGGIGYGSFFLLDGNATLGREESRAGRFLDRRDYCKLHIISHYVKAFAGNGFEVFPIGKVGRDADGARLAREMNAIGIDTQFVEETAAGPTLFSFCFLYPDGSGGNLTTRDSACNGVDAGSIQAAEPVMKRLGTAGIALAVPEVPLEARRALLEAASRHGLFKAASFTRAEMDEVRASRDMELVDFCALNLEEAAAAAGIAHEALGEREPAETVRACAETLAEDFPRLQLSITAGRSGSWSWDGRDLAFDPAVRVESAGTSGAGDAHFAGMLSGLAVDLPLSEAQQLGTVVAGASVMSPHTINPEITMDLLRSVCALRKQTAVRVLALLDMGNGGS